MENTSTAPAAPPGPLAGFATLVIVLIALIAWIVIGTRFMADTSLVGGFLMLWYWANNEQLALNRLPAALIGAVVGIGLGWALVYGAVNYGTAGLITALLLLILALYLDIIKAVPLFVNTATMLYVTIAAAPLVQLHVNWVELVLSTVLGGLFFAAYVEAAKWLAGKMAPTATG